MCRTNKIAIGTAQFGFNYGISNVSGEVSIYEMKEILSYAKKYQIETIDTAKAYGNSETKLGKVSVRQFK